MLEVAVVLSAVAQRWEDFAVIFVMLLINGGVSFWHESKASDAIEALKEKLSPEARVIRNGSKKKISSEKLVPGDIINLRIGDIVPSDAKLLDNENASIDESTLTGESLPVTKHGSDQAYSGTTVKRGDAKAVVTSTGRNTKFARTIELVEEAEEKSHFQKAVLRIGYFLISATAVLAAIIIISGIIQGEPIFEILIFALVVTIAGIPQALPAVLSVTMSIGANTLAKMKAIVSKLSAMEEIAGLEVLCADKTGTLTKNELEMQDPVVINGKDKNEVINSAALTCQIDEEEDPIDKAVLEGVKDKEDLEKYQVNEIRPFNPTDKKAEADVTLNNKSFTVAKGAPQVILDLCSLSDDEKNKIRNRIDELGAQGFRSLGVGKKGNDEWQYLGLLPLLDPPREDSADVVKDAQEHGIDVRMITGDHGAIGKQAAQQIGMGDKFIGVKEIFEKEDKSEEEESKLNEEFINANGYAQVTPEHKFKIIKRFQKNDRIIGMTGDGVNDAPALKQADIGIAVSKATDAARSAADLVLTRPGLGVITRAIEESRRIFERMTGYATFRITESMRVLLFLTFSILIFQFYPVTPIMVVLLAILNDIPIMTIAFDNVKTASNPVRWDMKRVLTLASILSIGGVISSFILFWFIYIKLGFPEPVVQSMIFLKLLVAGHMTIFLTRNQGWLWDKPLPDWKLFVSLEGTQIIGTLFAVYGILIHPIGWAKALSIWAYAAVWILFLNVIKVIWIKAAGKFNE